MSEPKKRIQFDFTEGVLEEIEQMQKATGLSTRAELIRHALRFLQWIVEEVRDKKSTLLIERDGVVREVVFPFWKQN